MESAGIFTQSHIEELQNNDSIVGYNLAKFCGITKKELIDALYLRNKATSRGEVIVKNTVKIKDLSYGYHILEVKVGKKMRTILNPALIIKKIQEQLSERFTRVPVSLAATGGKHGDSHMRNAELHKAHPYLMTMDLKNAYPSIGTQRIYANIQGGLLKNLKIRAPTLASDEDKDLFIKAITHLCVYNNQLPQGASTSSQLINIILSSVDGEIEKRMLELVGYNSIYTRYIDDISISFPHYPSMGVLKEKEELYRNKIAAIQLIDNTENQLIAIEDIVRTFSQEVFHIADNYEFAYVQSIAQLLEKEIEKYKRYDNHDKIYKYIGIIHQYKNQIINIPMHIRDMQDDFLKILRAKGWTVNQKKTKIYTPQSGKLREITGITYTADGKRGINAQKKAAMKRLFQDLGTLTNREICNHSFYKYHFCTVIANLQPVQYEIDKEKILRVIQGKYNYLMAVYGKENIPQDLQKPYNILKKKRDILDADVVIPPEENRLTRDDLPF